MGCFMKRFGVRISIALAVGALFCGASGAQIQYQVGFPTHIPVSVDARVELMSLIFRLAGNPEYNRGQIAIYNADVDRTFAPFADHDAVRLARQLRQTRGVSYDAVMAMAFHVAEATSLQESIPLAPQPATLDDRWTPELARGFLAAARRFVDETGFTSFFNRHQDLYDTAASRMQAVLDEYDIVAWCELFFGTRPGARFELALGLLNGPANYGARIKLAEDREILYCVLGATGTDDRGEPQFDDQVMSTVVHEFCHSYCNPLVDGHAAELAGPSRVLFSRVQDGMTRMAYGHWETMIRESLVRASVVRWIQATFGEEAARQLVAKEQQRQFYWLDGLADLLEQYENTRTRYATLTDFFPEIVRFFGDYAENIDAHIDAYESQQRQQQAELTSGSPRVVATVPANGAREVDPDLGAIVVRFDRPMRDKTWSVMVLEDKFPEVVGGVFYDVTRTIFTIPVRLEPGVRYELGLNSASKQAFISEAGDPLQPFAIRFETAERR